MDIVVVYNPKKFKIGPVFKEFPIITDRLTSISIDQIDEEKEVEI